MRYTLGSAARFRRWWGAVPTWRHRERVRFGAWESRPQGAAVGRSGPGAGGSEGPQIPGPENTYKCAHCGRVLGGFEAGIAYVGTAPVCHPNDDGTDCYRRVTVYGEKLGARR